MKDVFIHTAKDSGVLRITIDRQDKLNALNKLVVEQLHHAFSAAARDDDVNCIVLTGAGNRAFVAGADIAEIRSLDSDGVQQLIRLGNELMNLVEGLGKPVIAAVNGFALGGGCELALACHLRVAARTAQLGLPEIQLGLMPGYGGTQRLSRLVGHGRALEMMLSGKPVNAEQALQWGLVNMVTEPEELESIVNRLATRLARSAPLAMKGILGAVKDGADLALSEALGVEASHFASLFDSEDMREGTSAFLEKRKPEFSGR